MGYSFKHGEHTTSIDNKRHGDAQDVTLGELLAMMAQDGLARREEMRAMGNRKKAEREKKARPIDTRELKRD